jgi:hypothetical protein
MLGVCVPPASAQNQLETAYTAIKPSLVFVMNYHAGKFSAAGSGFVVGHRDGHMLVVTNRHVIEGGDSFKGVIQSPTQVAFGLTILTVGKSDDLALLESTKLDAPAVSLAMTLPPLGHAISIAGYPRTQLFIAMEGGGLTPSVHAGNVNALPQNGYYIQYDAQTDHGNSGGPLFDAETALVYGIVVLKYGSIETNFAISAVSLRTFLANASVFPSTNPVVVTGVVSIPTTPPTAAARGSIDRASCVSATLDFLKSLRADAANFARYHKAEEATMESLGAAKDRESLAGPSTLGGIELQTIQTIIRDDEPQLSAAGERIVGSGAAAMGEAARAVTADIATRDQDALQASLERKHVIDDVINGGLGKVTGDLDRETKRMSFQVLHDLTDIDNLATCDR